MSQLFVYHSSQPKQALKVLNHAEDISSTLAQAGVRFEHWAANPALTAQSTHEDILAAYAADIARVKQERGDLTVDVVSIDEKHPDKVELRAQFIDEHTHSEDEVRFFVSGRGLFNLHINEHIYAVLCEKGAFLSVPAGTQHWFDMGEHPRFTALRFFNNLEGLVAQFTGDGIAADYPLLDDLV